MLDLPAPHQAPREEDAPAEATDPAKPGTHFHPAACWTISAEPESRIPAAELLLCGMLFGGTNLLNIRLRFTGQPPLVTMTNL